MSFLLAGKKADFYKLVDDGSGKVERYQLHNPLTNIKVDVQSVGAEYAVVGAEGEFGKLFRVFMIESGVLPDMVMTTQSTATYSGLRFKVIGVQRWDTMSPHYSELLVSQITD